MDTEPNGPVGIPRLIHDYARTWAAWHQRQGHYSYSFRTKYLAMTTEQISAELDSLREEILAKYGTEAL